MLFCYRLILVVLEKGSLNSCCCCSRYNLTGCWYVFVMPGDFLLRDTVIAQCMLCPGDVCVCLPSEVKSSINMAPHIIMQP